MCFERPRSAYQYRYQFHWQHGFRMWERPVLWGRYRNDWLWDSQCVHFGILGALGGGEHVQEFWNLFFRCRYDTCANDAFCCVVLLFFCKGHSPCSTILKHFIVRYFSFLFFFSFKWPFFLFYNTDIFHFIVFFLFEPFIVLYNSDAFCYNLTVSVYISLSF